MCGIVILQTSQTGNYVELFMMIMMMMIMMTTTIMNCTVNLRWHTTDNLHPNHTDTTPTPQPHYTHTTPTPHPHHNFFHKVWCGCGVDVV